MVGERREDRAHLLAEVQGLSGNIIGLHQSRAEYFILHGNLDQAEKQLSYALKLTRGDYLTKRENILLVGPSGTGKTHLASALAMAACAQGKRVRFWRQS